MGKGFKIFLGIATGLAGVGGALVTIGAIRAWRARSAAQGGTVA